MSLRQATMEEVPDLCKEFRKLEKKLKAEGKPPIFSFVRQDYLERCVKAGILYYDNGIIAVVKQYKVKTKYGSRKGDWCMPEVLNTNPKNGTAIFKFMRAVFDEKVKGARLYGSVRDDNTNSIKWHETMGYQRVMDVTWDHGKIPGGVYMYDNAPKSNN